MSQIPIVLQKAFRQLDEDYWLDYANYTRRIVHGLTDNDNPTAGNLTDVYNGLAIAFVLGDDGSSTLTYAAESNEHLTFTISSVTAVNDLQATAEDTGGKDIGSITVDAYSSSYLPEELVVTASSSGNLNLKIKGDASDAGAMFIVGVNSSIPLTNCTLGDDTSSGLSTGAKAGIGIAVPLLVGVFAAGSYFLWMYPRLRGGRSSIGKAYLPRLGMPLFNTHQIRR